MKGERGGDFQKEGAPRRNNGVHQVGNGSFRFHMME